MALAGFHYFFAIYMCFYGFKLSFLVAFMTSDMLVIDALPKEKTLCFY